MAPELARRIGESKVIDDRDLLEEYAGDESHVEPRMPDLAVRARSREDVLAVLELAAEHGVPITPRGGGTGKVGGAIAAAGGAVLDLTRLAEIREISCEDLIAVVEPGVVLGELQAAVEDEGLFYPPDPNSLESCTIGGNAAHNAGGPRAFKYGVTREYVLGAETALLGGETLRSGRRTIKGVAGYDLTALLVGSEGTLGVFTELTLRLVRKPPALATLLVRLPDEATGARSVEGIVAAGMVPRVLEFIDGKLVAVLREAGAGAVPEGTGALLLAELDGLFDEDVERDAIRLAELCESRGADEVLMARHGGEREQLWAARRVLSDSIKQRVRHKVAEDVVVPRSRAVELLAGLRGLEEKWGVELASYGHAGDGNYHVNVLWNDDAFDPEPVVADVFALTLALDGTITGEHGIGLAKRAYLPDELRAPLIGIQRRIKEQFDPLGLMNPGKIF